MMTSFRVTNILEKLSELLPLSRESIESMSLGEVRTKVAKPLGISGSWKLKKAVLIDVCWAELEKARAMLAANEKARKEGESAISELRKIKDRDYDIPVVNIVDTIYSKIRLLASKSSDLQKAKEEINGIVATIAASEASFYTFSTVKSRRLEIKNGLQAMCNGELPLLQDTVQILIDYFYSALLSFQKSESIELSKRYKVKVAQKNRDKEGIRVADIINFARSTLEKLELGEKVRWEDVSIAVALGTGRRMAEIHSLGKFEVTGFKSLFFTGQAKTRDAENSQNDFEIPTLFPAHQLKFALDWLEESGKRLPNEVQMNDSKAVNNKFAMALSRAMKQFTGISYKGLRAIYAEIQWELFEGKARTEKHIKYSQWLGHICGEGANDSTFMSYMVYQILDLDELEL